MTSPVSVSHGFPSAGKISVKSFFDNLPHDPEGNLTISLICPSVRFGNALFNLFFKRFGAPPNRFTSSKIRSAIWRSKPSPKTRFISIQGAKLALNLSSMPLICSASSFGIPSFSCRYFANFPLVTFFIPLKRFSYTRIFSPGLAASNFNSPLPIRTLFNSFKTAYLAYSNEFFGNTSSPSRYVHLPVIRRIKPSADSSSFTISEKFHGKMRPSF